MRVTVINSPQQIKGKTGKVVHIVEREDGNFYSGIRKTALSVDAHQDDLEFIIGEEISKFAGQVDCH